MLKVRRSASTGKRPLDSQLPLIVERKGAPIRKAHEAVSDLKSEGYTAELMEKRGLGHDYTIDGSRKLWTRLQSIRFK